MSLRIKALFWYLSENVYSVHTVTVNSTDTGMCGAELIWIAPRAALH